MKTGILCLFILNSSAAFVLAGEWGINVHGFSYHPERRDEKGRKFNEVNPGLGVSYIFRTRPKSIWSMDAGCFDNSFRDAAAYAGVTWKYRFTSHLSAGVAGSLFYSHSYHNGRPFVAPFPVLTFREGPAAFNLIYFPKLTRFNPVAVFGVYASFYPF
jgi:hypothetical protein